MRNGLKSSLTRRLNHDVKRRDKWFVESASRKRVKDKEHFDHLVNTYLPSHVSCLRLGGLDKTLFRELLAPGYLLIPNPFSYAVIPFVSAMNAVSRLISSSWKSVNLWPASIKSVGRSL
jgi:hypothetical protein